MSHQARSLQAVRVSSSTNCAPLRQPDWDLGLALLALDGVGNLAFDDALVAADMAEVPVLVLILHNSTPQPGQHLKLA